MIASLRQSAESGAPASPFRLISPAAAVGVFAGLAAALFHFGVDKGFATFQSIASGAAGLPVPGWLAAAVLGAAMTTLAVYLVRHFTPEATGSGINEVEGVMHHVRPALRWRRVIPVKLIGGLAAMVSGLVLGREGPTIHVGASFATMIAARRGFATGDANLLVAAGAGAGLAAAFNAPLAGILFVFEELDDRLLASFAAMQAAAVASVIAVALSGTLLGQGPQLQIGPFPIPTAIDLLLLLPLGVLVGVFGVFFNWALLKALDGLRRVSRVSWVGVATVVGGAMGLIVAFYPDAAGGGEGLVVDLQQQPLALWALLALLLARFVAFLASYGCGTPGGLFAPLLSLGVIIGLLYAGVLQDMAPGMISSTGPFALSAIAALLAATVRAPLTGIALATALTGDYNLVLAMIATSAAASLVAEALGGRPIYAQLLERTLRIQQEERAAAEQQSVLAQVRDG